MKKFNRVVYSSGLMMLAGLTVLALTYVGAHTKGPLETFLSNVGGLVSRTESEMAFRFRGPGRAAELAAFDAIRQDADRLRRPERVLLGAYDNRLPGSFDGLTEMETALGEAMPLVHLFTAWGDAPGYRFPTRFAEAVWAIGSVPLLTWEPWLSTFDGGLHGHLPDAEGRDKGGMAAVARGDYDFYLAQWAEQAAAFGRPVFVRFGHEMNDAYRYPWGPHHNRPDDYVAAYRHVVETVRAAGAGNVIWVWSPHIAYDDFETYYPGDDVVDWVGATVLNYGTVAYWSQWWTFDDIFTRKYDRLTAFGKPVIIAELGTLMAGGERAPWFEQALTRLPQRLPEVKAVVFFHNRSDATITYQALDWAFAEDPPVVAAVRRGLETWSAASESVPDSLTVALP